MRNTIRRILKEAAKNNLKDILKKVGLLKARDLGIDSDLFLQILFDGKLIDYVKSVVPEMTQLTSYNLSRVSKTFEYEGSSPTFKKLLKKGQTTVFTVGPNENIGMNAEIYLHLEKYMTPKMIIDFIKEYYEIGEGNFRLFTFRT